MLDTFMKDMKGMVVEEVTIEEKPVEKEKEVSKKEEATQEGKRLRKKKRKKKRRWRIQKEIDATPIQTIPPSVEATPITSSLGKPKASKKRETRSRK